jgi:hypothetical protein
MPAASAKACSAPPMWRKPAPGPHGVELVDGKHDAGHAQQVDQQRVAAGLHQQLQLRVVPVQLGGVHQHHGGVGAAGGGDHVAGVLLVAGRVANDELALFGVAK